MPVISGNVSFYNETEGTSIYPTPAVAMVGVIPDLAGVPEACFRHAGDRIVLLGEDRSELGGSAYLRLLHDLEQGQAAGGGSRRRAAPRPPPAFAGRPGLLSTAHDLSEGGFLISLAEACFGGRLLGARVEVPLAGADLFSESQGRAIVACPAAALDRVLRAAEEAGVPAREIGEVGGDVLEVRSAGETFKAPVAGLHEIWSTALPRAAGAVSDGEFRGAVFR